MRDKALADFSKRPEDGQAIYEDTAHEVANQVAVRATQKAIRAGGVTECGDANNLNTRPPTPTTRPNGNQKGGGRGGGKGGGKGNGGVQSSGNPCFRKAYEGKCNDPKCPHLHDQSVIDKFKAKSGFEEKRKRWLSAGGIGREAGPASAPTKRVHATIKGTSEKDTSKGTKYNLFGDDAKKGKGGSHITFSAHATNKPRLFAYVKRIRQAAIDMAERVDRFINHHGNHKASELIDDAPAVGMDIVHTRSRDLLSLAVKEDWHIESVDVSEGFMQVEITEPTYADPPTSPVVFNEFPDMEFTHQPSLYWPLPATSIDSMKLEAAAKIACSFNQPEPDALGYNSWLNCEFPVLTSDMTNMHWSGDAHYTPAPRIADTRNEKPSLLLSSFGLLVPKGPGRWGSAPARPLLPPLGLGRRPSKKKHEIDRNTVQMSSIESRQ